MGLFVFGNRFTGDIEQPIVIGRTWYIHVDDPAGRDVLCWRMADILEIRSRAEQIAYNLRRWDEVLSESTWHQVEGRVETDRHGRIVMSPPPAPRHGRFQHKIQMLLEKLMPPGEVLPECPISTADGVRAADVAWVSPQRWRELGNRACFVQAPELCVEIISPANSDEEIREKIALYFDAGAEEVWTCGSFGQMTFFGPGSTPLQKSKLCPDFPVSV